MNKSDRRFLNWVFESAFVIGLAALGGSWLDDKLSTGANCLSLLLLFGFFIEGYSLYKIIKSTERK